jgi:gamma-glutamylcyclotransferase (GGCT)/AIG2-like uncharacterized protein YtfP|tara:strand:+ start:1036 stop:1416 length:381 start_codon:yes stop_codon:yes gene_type:complete
MKTDKLAVYGTLRNGKRDTWKVDGYQIVFPGHYSYPAALMDKNAKGAIVEIIDVDSYDLDGYDIYENIKTGLYERRIVNIYNDDGDKADAWMYIIGPALMQYNKVFELVPEQNWLSKRAKRKRMST